jgi:hypothetical protein
MNGKTFVAAVKVLLVVAGAATLCLGLAGCLGKRPKKTPLMKSSKGVGVTAEELRLRMRDGAGAYAGTIEDAANQIMEKSDDPIVRRNALMWKARAIPASQSALFQQDPLVALIDIWVLTVQMKDFFETGEGRDAFGDLQYVAIDACDLLDSTIEAAARDMATEHADFPKLRKQLNEFSRDYPIRSWSFNRESVPAHMEAFRKARAAGGLAAAGTMATDMSDLSARLGLLANQMPRQIMWETELMADTYVTREQVDEALSDLTDIPLAVDNLRLYAEDSVDQVLAEKEALFERLDEDMGALGEVYAETLTFVSSERQALTADLKAERAILLEALRAERQIAIDTLRAERAVVMEEIRALSGSAMDDFGGRIEGVIDHFFLRLAQLLAVLIVILGVGGFLVLRALRPRPV